MVKCEKCGTALQNSDILCWKCTNCDKTFKVDLPKLQSIYSQKNKTGNRNKSLLKCPSCGKGLDDGNETIYYKCSTCGNIITTNLDALLSADNEIKRTSNTGNIVATILHYLGVLILFFGSIGSVIVGSESGISDEFVFSIFAIYEFATILSGFIFIGISQIIQLLHEINSKL